MKWKRGFFVVALGILAISLTLVGTQFVRSRVDSLPPTVTLKEDCHVAAKVRIVSECPGTLDPARNAWQKVFVESGTKLRIGFIGGISPCFVLDRVDVVEDSQKVMLSVFQGYDPAYARYERAHPDSSYTFGSCLAIGIPRETFVELSGPLGDRRVVDGEGYPNYCAIKSTENGQDVWLSQGFSQPCPQA